MEHPVRWRFVWKTARGIVAPWMKRKFHYTPELCDADGTYLVLCNHNTDWDPLLLACAFPNYMAYVASEHIFRWGFVSLLLGFLIAPIARLKGKRASDTALTILRRLKKGTSVAMFAEGNRSFTGVTGEIFPATGKLARSSGAGLITYRLSGGYFSSPRWSGSTLRRGSMRGKVMHVLTPEQLRAMTPNEVTDLIRRDLFVDAYAEQRTEMIPFRGKNLAEHLETVLCLCPQCGALDSLHSSGNRIACRCGFCAEYNEYGFLEGENIPYDNLTEWDQAQTERLCTMVSGDAPVFTDTDMDLTEILPKHRSRRIGRGTLRLFRDRIECCGNTFPLDRLGGFSLRGAQTVNFHCDGRDYEITSPKVRCTRKYMTLIRHLTAGQ